MFSSILNGGMEFHGGGEEKTSMFFLLANDLIFQIAEEYFHRTYEVLCSFYNV